MTIARGGRCLFIARTLFINGPYSQIWNSFCHFTILPLVAFKGHSHQVIFGHPPYCAWAIFGWHMLRLQVLLVKMHKVISFIRYTVDPLFCIINLLSFASSTASFDCDMWGSDCHVGWVWQGQGHHLFPGLAIHRQSPDLLVDFSAALELAPATVGKAKVKTQHQPQNRCKFEWREIQHRHTEKLHSGQKMWWNVLSLRRRWWMMSRRCRNTD